MVRYLSQAFCSVGYFLLSAIASAFTISASSYACSSSLACCDCSTRIRSPFGNCSYTVSPPSGETYMGSILLAFFGISNIVCDPHLGVRVSFRLFPWHHPCVLG